VLARRIRIARREMNMEMLHGVAVHEGVNVLRVRTFLQDARKTVDKKAERGSFGVGEFTQSGLVRRS
jgi:hypothetical protein